MDLATLFGKLQEYEMELTRISLKEQAIKKSKGIALKASTPSKEKDEEKEDGDSENGLDEDEMSLFVKNYGKFFKKNFSKKSALPPRRRSKDEGSSQLTITCYECGKTGHYKSDCPNIQKKDKYEKKQTRIEGTSRRLISLGMTNLVLPMMTPRKKQTYASCKMGEHWRNRAKELNIYV
ncbi:uncharacterized protein LOC133289628 [Gastrolobium bilobum]|uniref:uncharacterized protein LOC133289628 n=1 Tax=Gastrolobium bilobum TaxID=150636 RepID=UPI002AB02DA4|nr:uncharacterized protein LOC133289628 [Gastrolobium bilobum]